MIRKHLGRLVSGSEPPPLCCGSQFSISCNQFSMGSTIKLKQKGCKKGESFSRLKQPSFLGLSCVLYSTGSDHLCSQQAPESPKYPNKSYRLCLNSKQLLARSLKHPGERRRSSQAWIKEEEPSFRRPEVSPPAVMRTHIPAEAVRLRQVGAETNLPVHLLRGKDVLWVLLLDLFMPGK